MTQNFNDELRKQLFVFQDKSERFDQKVSESLLRALGQNVPFVKADLGKEFGLVKVNQKFMPPGVAFEAAKFKKAVTLPSLIDPKTAKTEQWKTYEELQQNWSASTHFCMVFDKHDDGVGDLIMHGSSSLLNQDAWYFSFVGPDNHRYYIQSFKDFLVSFRKTYNENHNGETDEDG